MKIDRRVDKRQAQEGRRGRREKDREYEGQSRDDAGEREAEEMRQRRR